MSVHEVLMLLSFAIGVSLGGNIVLFIVWREARRWQR
jgi:hypothetical protein